MDLELVNDSNLVPRRREDIRIEGMILTPYPDRERVKVDIVITPFAPGDRPNIDIAVRKADDTQVASLSVIEAAQRKLSLTVHLRGAGEPEAQYVVQADLFFNQETVQHSVSATLVLSNDPFL